VKKLYYRIMMWWYTSRLRAAQQEVRLLQEKRFNNSRDIRDFAPVLTKDLVNDEPRGPMIPDPTFGYYTTAKPKKVGEEGYKGQDSNLSADVGKMLFGEVDPSNPTTEVVLLSTHQDGKTRELFTAKGSVRVWIEKTNGNAQITITGLMKQAEA
jgi:hypothetical protein